MRVHIYVYVGSRAQGLGWEILMWIYACTYVYLLQTYVSVFKTFLLQDGIYIHNFLCIHMYTYIHVFMSDCEAKKKTLHYSLLLCSHIFIFSICTHVRARGLGHCVYAAGVGFRDQGSIRLGLQGLGLCRDLYTCICIYICIYSPCLV